MGKVRTRILIGAALTAGTIGLLLADVALDAWTGLRLAPAFWALLAGSLLTGCLELFRMLRGRGYPCRPIIGTLFVGLLIAAVFVETQFEPRLGPWLHDRGLELYLLLIVGLVFTTFVVEIVLVERTGRDPPRALASVGWTLIVVLTVGLLGVFLAKIRFLRLGAGPAEHRPADGFLYLLLTLAVVKGGDIGAYTVGSSLGRHKLIPTLSPAKTVEGVFGAMALGIALALFIGLLWGRFTWPEMLLFGGAVSVSGVLGDLAESLMKRACGVKDSGPIPGFGGALDILDSLLAAGPVAYLLLTLQRPMPS
jgi:phosphatidate cytidylyltransferase